MTNYLFVVFPATRIITSSRRFNGTVTLDHSSCCNQGWPLVTVVDQSCELLLQGSGRLQLLKLLNELWHRIFLRSALLSEQLFHGNSGAVHHVRDAACSNRVQTSSSDLILRCHSDEPNHLVFDWRDVLCRIPDDWCALVRCLVGIKLSSVPTRTVLGEQPRLRDRLNKPILIIDSPHALGVRSRYLQCART